MGKVDDMRRLREAQHEEGQRAARASAARPAQAAPATTAKAPVTAARAAAPADVDPVEDAMVPSTRSTQASPTATARAGKSKRAAAGEDVGTCSSCGKAKPMQRGVIASHQKGLGKACPGSRKPPAA